MPLDGLLKTVESSKIRTIARACAHYTKASYWRQKVRDHQYKVPPIAVMNGSLARFCGFLLCGYSALIFHFAPCAAFRNDLGMKKFVCWRRGEWSARSCQRPGPSSSRRATGRGPHGVCDDNRNPDRRPHLERLLLIVMHWTETCGDNTPQYGGESQGGVDNY
jgi:hypothetical protein